MSEYQILKISENNYLKEPAACWFHEKWGIPVSAYEESMEECIKNGIENKAENSVEGRRGAGNFVPQWYVVMDGTKIIGGLGVIENDFHDRKDLSPNVCAVYVEEEYRCRGIAGNMLHEVCRDMNEKGIDTLYLITDHSSFYERYGWEFLCMVRGDGETEMTRMYVHRQANGSAIG